MAASVPPPNQQVPREARTQFQYGIIRGSQRVSPKGKRKTTQLIGIAGYFSFGDETDPNFVSNYPNGDALAFTVPC